MQTKLTWDGHIVSGKVIADLRQSKREDWSWQKNKLCKYMRVQMKVDLQSQLMEGMEWYGNVCQFVWKTCGKRFTQFCFET